MSNLKVEPFSQNSADRRQEDSSLCKVNIRLFPSSSGEYPSHLVCTFGLVAFSSLDLCHHHCRLLSRPQQTRLAIQSRPNKITASHSPLSSSFRLVGKATYDSPTRSSLEPFSLLPRGQPHVNEVARQSLIFSLDRSPDQHCAFSDICPSFLGILLHT